MAEKLLTPSFCDGASAAYFVRYNNILNMEHIDASS